MKMEEPLSENYMENIGKRAKTASAYMASLDTIHKNKALKAVSQALLNNKDRIIAANKVDINNAVKNGMHEGMVDRLLLTEKRIESMADGINQLILLEDPIGAVQSMKRRPNGLIIGKKTVPLGVVGIIYESRPNVTTDAFGLAFKSGNAVILRGGSDAIHSVVEITNIIREALTNNGFNPDAIMLIDRTDRKYVDELMHMNDYVDVLIPRGGNGLIKNVVNNSTVPVIETGTGNCHIYVDKYADLDMACNIIYNAKTQRIGVCNACESLVVHKDICNDFIPRIVDVLKQKNVEIYGDELALSIDNRILKATEEDWGREYLDYKISLKTVDNIDQAIDHINKYNTGHSEAIITENYTNAQKFLDRIDAAAVYVNASTRFTDGNEFGFGAEIGISTQKIHARGPMGLEALTTSKYIIYGNGQVRD